MGCLLCRDAVLAVECWRHCRQPVAAARAVVLVAPGVSSGLQRPAVALRAPARSAPRPAGPACADIAPWPRRRRGWRWRRCPARDCANPTQSGLRQAARWPARCQTTAWPAVVRARSQRPRARRGLAARGGPIAGVIAPRSVAQIAPRCRVWARHPPYRRTEWRATPRPFAGARCAGWPWPRRWPPERTAGSPKVPGSSSAASCSPSRSC